MDRPCGMRAEAPEEARNDHSELICRTRTRLDLQFWAVWFRSELSLTFLDP